MVELGSRNPTHLTSKGRATRIRIIDAATALIAGQGALNTTIDDVRKAAGVSGSQMTHYFVDKSSLIIAVIEQQADELVRYHHQPRFSGLTTIEALQLWADLNIDGDCPASCEYCALAAEVHPQDESIQSAVACGYERWTAVLQAGLEVMRECGELRAEANPRALAQLLIVAHQGGSLLMRTYRTAEPLRNALNTTLDFIRSLRY